jgi:hypothetical protein
MSIAPSVVLVIASVVSVDPSVVAVDPSVVSVPSSPLGLQAARTRPNVRRIASHLDLILMCFLPPLYETGKPVLLPDRSIGERPTLPIVADPEPYPVQAERLEDQEPDDQ